MKKLKAEVNKQRKALSEDMLRLRTELAHHFDEYKAEELYTLEGEYNALMADPTNYE